MLTPLTDSYEHMQIAESLDSAFATMRRLLLRPFHLAVWVSFGVIVFLETQLNNLRFPALSLLEPDFDDRGVRDWAETSVEYVLAHAIFVAGILLVSLLGYVIVMVLATWLRTRAQLMFVRAVATGEHQLEDNWRETKPCHESLFLASITLKGIGLLGNILTVAVSWIVLLIFGTNEVVSFVGALLFIAPITIVWSLAAVVLWLLNAVLRHFITPIMWHFDIGCTEAIGIFRSILPGNGLALIGFCVALVCFHVVLAVVGTLIGLFTCFVGFLPVVHQTVLAPLYVMERAFSMALIESLGPRFRMRGEA